MFRKFKIDDGNVIYIRNKWIERCWILNLMVLKVSFMYSIYIKICLILKKFECNKCKKKKKEKDFLEYNNL